MRVSRSGCVLLCGPAPQKLWTAMQKQQHFAAFCIGRDRVDMLSAWEYLGCRWVDIILGFGQRGQALAIQDARTRHMWMDKEGRGRGQVGYSPRNPVAESDGSANLSRRS